MANASDIFGSTAVTVETSPATSSGHLFFDKNVLFDKKLKFDILAISERAAYRSKDTGKKDWELLVRVSAPIQASSRNTVQNTTTAVITLGQNVKSAVFATAGNKQIKQDDVLRAMAEILKKEGEVIEGMMLTRVGDYRTWLLVPASK